LYFSIKDKADIGHFTSEGREARNLQAVLKDFVFKRIPAQQRCWRWVMTLAYLEATRLCLKALGSDWPQFRASTRGISRVSQRKSCDLVRVQSS
jgi:hypothetical protein